jgi:NitT/TauT family transport system substrate-binding protein
VARVFGVLSGLPRCGRAWGSIARGGPVPPGGKQQELSMTYGRLTVVLLMAAGLISVDGQVQAQSKEPSIDPDTLAKVVIATSTRSRNPGFSNMWIGKGLGLYAEDGIDLQVEGTSGHAENLQLLMTDQVNMSVGVQDTVLNAQAEGRMLPVVAPCNYLRGIIYHVIALPDSGIGDFAALAGKTIGVQSLSSAVVPYVKFALANVDVDPSSVSFIAVGTGQQAAVALTQKRIDALATSDVEAAQFDALGVDFDMLDQPKVIADMAAGHVFAFHKPWYDAHKDLVVKTVQDQIKSIIFMLENPEAAVRVSFKMYPESIPEGVPLDQAVADAVTIIKVRAPLIEKESGDVKRWCEFSPEAWKNYTSMIGLEGKADPSKFYTNELIDEINDFDEAGFREWARAYSAE